MSKVKTTRKEECDWKWFPAEDFRYNPCPVFYFAYSSLFTPGRPAGSHWLDEILKPKIFPSSDSGATGETQLGIWDGGDLLWVLLSSEMQGRVLFRVSSKCKFYSIFIQSSKLKWITKYLQITDFTTPSYLGVSAVSLWLALETGKPLFLYRISKPWVLPIWDISSQWNSSRSSQGWVKSSPSISKWRWQWMRWGLCIKDGKTWWILVENKYWFLDPVGPVPTLSKPLWAEPDFHPRLRQGDHESLRRGAEWWN